MTRPRLLPRRSRAEWTIRAGLALGALALGYAGVTFSLAQVVAKTDPARAHQLAPYDGRITALYAASLSGAGGGRADFPRAKRLARLGLRQDPMAVGALVTLGLISDATGDSAAARTSFAYTAQLTRRDITTQLWMIENAVHRGDVTGALRHYDTALRTTPKLGNLLFPVLASAIDDPDIRQQVVRILATKPLWTDSFLGFVSDVGRNPQTTAALFLDVRRAGIAVPAAVRAKVIDSLAAANRIDDAWAYYASTHPGADRRRSRDPDFAAVAAAPTRFDWSTVDGEGANVALAPGAFDFSVPAGVGGRLLQQTLLLTPGRYRLSGRGSGIDQSENARPYWSLSCGNGGELGRVPMPNSSQFQGRFTGSFAVPQNCPVQTLVLVAPPSDASSGSSGRIDHVELVPLA